MPIEYIIQQTAASFRVERADLRNDVRFPDIVRARFAAMYIARELTGAGIAKLGRAFKRDHTTICHGLARCKHEMMEDDAYTAKIKLLMIRLRTDLAIGQKVRGEAFELMLQGERELTVCAAANPHKNLRRRTVQPLLNGASSGPLSAGDA